MENENLAIRYVEGVKKTNPEKNPTWGLVETAFLAGMSERQNQKRRVINKKGDLIYASCATIEPYEVYTFPPSPKDYFTLQLT